MFYYNLYYSEHETSGKGTDLVEEEVVGAVGEEGSRLLHVEPLVAAEDQVVVNI
jgi:hypothetical protein